MKIGCPTEIKPQEFRVGLARPRHEVIVQAGAGKGAGSMPPTSPPGPRSVDTAAESSRPPT